MTRRTRSTSGIWRFLMIIFSQARDFILEIAAQFFTWMQKKVDQQFKNWILPDELDIYEDADITSGEFWPISLFSDNEYHCNSK